MCLMRVKEEPDYTVPARVRSYKRTSRRYSSPPRYYTDEPEYYSRRVSRRYEPEPVYTDRRYDRYSSSRVVEERKPSTVALPPPADPPAAPPAPSVHTDPPPPPSVHTNPPPPPSVHTSPPPPPSIPPPPRSHHSTAKHDTLTSVSRNPSRAPSARTGTRTHFVEVEHDADSGTSSSSSSSQSSLDDLRSRTTHKTNHTRNTSHTNKSHRTSVSSSHKPPASEYSIHEREKEIRRERGYSRPRDQYETYRYVNAPPLQPDDGYGPPAGQRRSGSRRDYWR